MKFGGTSVGTSEAIKQMVDIISREKERVVVVVSAYAKVTDQLIEIAQQAKVGNSSYLALYKELCDRHLVVVETLLQSPSLRLATKKHVKQLLVELEGVLRGVFLVKEATPKLLDYIMSFGERLSATTIASYIEERGRSSSFVDTRRLIKTDAQFGYARVDMLQTGRIVKRWYKALSKKRQRTVPVATGFIGSTAMGETTTLGRGGSDYTASILGCLLGVRAIEIWTDVDGVMSANPKQVPGAFSLPAMTYEEAVEMSHFGSRVIYAPTMVPAMEKNIPIVIKNTFNPEFPGTIISQRTSNGYLIKGISSLSPIAMLLIEGSAMVGVPMATARIFQALARWGINVLMISQASSEHTVCLAVLPKDLDSATYALQDEFKREQRDGTIEALSIDTHCSTLAIVGEHMRRTPGIAGKLFDALGNSQVSIIAIAQGSSERNISFVVKQEDEMKALRTIHDAFFAQRL